MRRNPATAPCEPRWSHYTLYGYGAWIVVLGFQGFSVDYLDIPLERTASVLASRYYPRDVDYVLDRDYMGSVVETI